MSDRLTKVITDEEGKEFVACAFLGTEMCHYIHTGKGCFDCPMFAAILNKLKVIEDTLSEVNNDTVS